MGISDGLKKFRILFNYSAKSDEFQSKPHKESTLEIIMEKPIFVGNQISGNSGDRLPPLGIIPHVKLISWIIQDFWGIAV